MKIAHFYLYNQMCSLYLLFKSWGDTISNFPRTQTLFLKSLKWKLLIVIHIMKCVPYIYNLKVAGA